MNLGPEAQISPLTISVAIGLKSSGLFERAFETPFPKAFIVPSYLSQRPQEQGQARPQTR
jgi:hypothetical protein